MSKKYEDLKELLLELFQLDQPDLDFGLYRVLAVRRDEIVRYLDRDLRGQVSAAFAGYRSADKTELEQQLQVAIGQAQQLGADPDSLPKVKELREKLRTQVVDVAGLEADVYNHLFRFFRRYYSEGDFLSKRVYKKDTYAIPYEGEEVMLHWANKDQYYIKTSVDLHDYSFRLRPDSDTQPMRVHFRLADVAEGEHGNAKEVAGKERRFVLAANPFHLAAGELVILFHYQPHALPQRKLLDDAEAALLAASDPQFAEWVQALGVRHRRDDGSLGPTRLHVYLDRYFQRNKTDYFIHKDLGPFLKRELDFYIKNEVMHLDDIESATAPRVEQYLSKLRALRAVAHSVIVFLAQLEDFQKTLWLKKKFVVETSYCVRVGLLPEAMLAEVAGNDAQRQEWVELHGIDTIRGDLARPGYSRPLTVSFIQNHPTLMVDTRHFDPSFAHRLIAGFDGLDDATDGVLFHGENFQALALMQARYREQVRCIYIDPPYNTGDGDFAYKDSYMHSSWATAMHDRVGQARNLLEERGLLAVSIDEHESHHCRMVCDLVFSRGGLAAELIWNTQHSQQSGLFAPYHEYIQIYTRIPPKALDNFTGGDGTIEAGALKKISKANPASNFTFPPGVPWQAPDGTQLQGTWGGAETVELVDGTMICEHGKSQHQVTLRAGWTQKRQMEKFFAGERPVLDTKGQEVTGFFFTSTGKVKITKKRSRVTPSTILPLFGTGSASTELLDDILGWPSPIGHPKPPAMLHYLIGLPTDDSAPHVVLDFFAGSGTTGHAITSLNREDGGNRKFILAEINSYFYTVLLPRLKKITYTPEWKDGRPKRLATPEETDRSPRILKILRLESYEDTLNNLDLRRTQAQQALLDTSDADPGSTFSADYRLQYMLPTESRGSPSLLNIAAFADPTAYTLDVKVPGSDETQRKAVDLLETFNWLLGLTVKTIEAPEIYAATFDANAEGRVTVKQFRPDPSGPYWFRRVTGVLRDERKVLIIWRKQTGNPTHDNIALDEYGRKLNLNTLDSEFDLVYVNGGNNLQNLRHPDDTWKVRLIEEEFQRLMFATEGV